MNREYDHLTESVIPVDFKNFNYKAAGIVLTVFGAALLFWLSNYFVTKEQYTHDQNAQSEILKEMRNDIKELIKRK